MKIEIDMPAFWSPIQEVRDALAEISAKLEHLVETKPAVLVEFVLVGNQDGGYSATLKPNGKLRMLRATIRDVEQHLAAADASQA